MPQEPKQARIVRIIDGDTVLVKERGGLLRSPPEERIRMWGIDAPESGQQGGRESAAYLNKIMGQGKPVWMTRMSRDQYGRTVAVLHRNRANPAGSFNLEMVREAMPGVICCPARTRPATGPPSRKPGGAGADCGAAAEGSKSRGDTAAGNGARRPGCAASSWHCCWRP